jgi:hypothetical protein
MTTDRSVSSVPAATSVADAPPISLRVTGSSLARTIRTPTTALVLLVGLSTVVRGALSLRVPSPWILPDEVVYSELARSIADGALPSIRGVPVLGWGEVYPMLIAPAWVVFEDMVSAYHAALLLNSLVMSLAAVPAYFLSRLFASRKLSMLVALLTLLVPSMSYTAVVMTENACYPAFLLAVLLMARAVRWPTVGNQALALLGLGVLALTRIQGVALLGAYIVAVALYAATGAVSERLPYLRRFAPTAAVVLPLSFAPVVVSLAHGDGVLGWFGPRSGTFEAIQLGEAPQWFVYLTAGLVLYVAVVPAAASAVLIGRGLSTRAPEPVRLFAAIALPTFVALLGSVSLVSASIDVDGTENLNERYVFYLVPIILVGLALWIRRDTRQRKRWGIVVVAGACVLVASLPVDRLAYNAEFQSLALLPWIEISGSRVAVGAMVAGFTLACGTVWLSTGRGRPGRMWLVVGVWMAFLGLVAVGKGAKPASYFAHAFEGRTAGWVDDAVPPGSTVPVVWDQRLTDRGPDALYYWLAVTEFFNKSVSDVYRIGDPTYYEGVLPTMPVRVAPGGSLTTPAGKRLTSRYVLVTCRTPVRGHVIAEASQGAVQLVEVEEPLTLEGRRACLSP